MRTIPFLMCFLLTIMAAVIGAGIGAWGGIASAALSVILFVGDEIVRALRDK